MNMNTDPIESRSTVINDVLNTGDFDVIGEETDDINEFSDMIGLPLVYKSQGDWDVAVYSDGSRHAWVADANGPIMVRS